MSMTSKVKYFAAGFLEDAGRLLNEYIEVKNPLDFGSFASVWKKHKFSLIFMGRPNNIELTEFTNEIFRIVTQFLSTASFTYKVGSVFLLYALFRNQISDPPIKIRLDPSHWLIIKKVREKAMEKSYRCVHYVIDYLISNAFIYVKNQTLRGPVTSSIKKVTRYSEKIANFNANYKIELTEYGSSNNLMELQQLQRQYIEMKKKLNCNVKLNKSTDPELYEKISMDLNNILKSPQSNRNPRNKEIGSRRAELKAASFSRKSAKFRGRTLGSDDEFDSPANDDDDYRPARKSLHTKRPRRAPHEQRKVGRPRKKPLRETGETSVTDPVDNIDISNLLQQQQDFFLPSEPEPSTSRRTRTARMLYYKLSPKHCDES